MRKKALLSFIALYAAVNGYAIFRLGQQFGDSAMTGGIVRMLVVTISGYLTILGHRWAKWILSLFLTFGAVFVFFEIVTGFSWLYLAIVAINVLGLVAVHFLPGKT